MSFKRKRQRRALRALWVSPVDRPRLRAKQAKWFSGLGIVPIPGERMDVTVKHDGWCSLLKTGGDCDCEPEFVLKRPESN